MARRQTCWKRFPDALPADSCGPPSLPPPGDPPGVAGSGPMLWESTFFFSPPGGHLLIFAPGELCPCLERWLPCVFQGPLLFINLLEGQSFMVFRDGSSQFLLSLFICLACECACITGIL